MREEEEEGEVEGFTHALSFSQHDSPAFACGAALALVPCLRTHGTIAAAAQGAGGGSGGRGGVFKARRRKRVLEGVYLISHARAR